MLVIDQAMMNVARALVASGLDAHCECCLQVLQDSGFRVHGVQGVGSRAACTLASLAPAQTLSDKHSPTNTPRRQALGSAG